MYSFGVVLLQIITCRPAISGGQDDKSHLSQWVRFMIESYGNINDIVDPKLRGVYDVASAWKLVEVALSCVSLKTSERPNMSRVVTELRECLALELSRTKAKDCLAANSTHSKSDLLSPDIVSEFRPLAR